MKTREMIQEIISGALWFFMCALCAVAVMVLGGCTPYLKF